MPRWANAWLSTPYGSSICGGSRGAHRRGGSTRWDSRAAEDGHLRRRHGQHAVQADVADALGADEQPVGHRMAGEAGADQPGPAAEMQAGQHGAHRMRVRDVRREPVDPGRVRRDRPDGQAHPLGDSRCCRCHLDGGHRRQGRLVPDDDQPVGSGVPLRHSSVSWWRCQRWLAGSATPQPAGVCRVSASKQSSASCPIRLPSSRGCSTVTSMRTWPPSTRLTPAARVRAPRPWTVRSGHRETAAAPRAARRSTRPRPRTGPPSARRAWRAPAPRPA